MHAHLQRKRRKNKENPLGGVSSLKVQKSPQATALFKENSLIRLLKNPLWVQRTDNDYTLLTNEHSSAVDLPALIRHAEDVALT